MDQYFQYDGISVTGIYRINRTAQTSRTNSVVTQKANCIDVTEQGRFLTACKIFSRLRADRDAGTALAANVKAPSGGGVAGKFCRLDRAMIFEDPHGTRVLYDPGMTVTGPDDLRPGKIDVVLVAHMHPDWFSSAVTGRQP